MTEQKCTTAAMQVANAMASLLRAMTTTPGVPLERARLLCDQWEAAKPPKRKQQPVDAAMPDTLPEAHPIQLNEGSAMPVDMAQAKRWITQLRGQVESKDAAIRALEAKLAERDGECESLSGLVNAQDTALAAMEAPAAPSVTPELPKPRFMWTSLFTNTKTGIQFAIATDARADCHTMADELLGCDDLDTRKVYEVAIVKKAGWDALAAAPAQPVPETIAEWLAKAIDSGLVNIVGPARAMLDYYEGAEPSAQPVPAPVARELTDAEISNHLMGSLDFNYWEHSNSWTTSGSVKLSELVEVVAAIQRQTGKGE